MLQRILDLQKEIYQAVTTDETGNVLPFYPEYTPYMAFSQNGELFSLSFFGDGHDDDPQIKAVNFKKEDWYNFAFCRFLDFIAEPENAEKILSLKFHGADEGGNGFKTWDFNRLANAEVIFPNLKHFEVKLTDLGDHNTSILDNGFSYEENGITAKLLQKMPNLASLILPSAPNQDFFEVGEHPLQYLKIQAGYNNENFIENWAKSQSFPHLVAVDYSEVIDVFDREQEDYTPFEAFKTLFHSQAFSSVKHFTLRNFNLTREELIELQKLNPVQFLTIDAHGGKYVNHFRGK